MVSSMKRIVLTVMIFTLAFCGFILNVPPFPSTAQAAVGEGTPGTLDDYWNGNASWVYLKKDTFTSTGQENYSYGNHTEVMPDGAWYYFNRILIKTYNAGCPNNDGLGTQVRKSTDKGATWSAPVTIIAPTAGTAYSCYATDGDAWYNPTENKWHYLFQCWDGVTSRGCELERSGSDPMGSFTIQPTGGNPTIDPGELWNSICNVSTDDCSTLAGGPGKVDGEGTYNIFKYDGTYYWVAFHGYDGVNGYQGIAKTIDFQTWIAGDASQGVANDAIFDRLDSQSWRENWDGGVSIGGGKGVILQEGSYYYNLVEAADINLSCMPNQNWNFGLYRSTSLTSTSWTPFPAGNPIVYSSKAETGGQSYCPAAYMGMFKDPTNNFIYLSYGRRSADPNYEGVYWYRLEKSKNLLKNSDLWTADASNWTKVVNSTNMVVYRAPNNSWDGTQYMEFNCGGSCTGANSVYQDVTIPGGTAGTVQFGGKFMAVGGADSILLSVYQMDLNHNVLKQDQHLLSVGPNWTTFDKSGSLLSSTRILRYQFYFYNPSLNFRADDMYMKY